MVDRKLLALVLGVSLVLMPQGAVGQTIDELFDRGNAAQAERRYSNPKWFAETDRLKPPYRNNLF